MGSCQYLPEQVKMNMKTILPPVKLAIISKLFRRYFVMKKICCLLLTVILAISSILVVNAEGQIFSDVSEHSWYYKAVSHVKDKGIMSGIGNNRFSPDTPVTRAQFVQILHNLSPLEEFSVQHFVDVSPNSWYFNAVEWAAKYGVVSGVGNKRYDPNSSITREQMATMLHRYFEKTGNESSPINESLLTRYTDLAKVSDWAKESMSWCVSNGILSGRSSTTLNPKSTATRAEAAQIMYNIKDKLANTVIDGEVVLPDLDDIDIKIASMSLEQKVGQIFLTRFRGTQEDVEPAGYMLFAKDFEGDNYIDTTTTIDRMQEYAKTGLFIAVDEEGGTVNRVSINPRLRDTPFKSLQQIYNEEGLEGIKNDTFDKSRYLQIYGINLNLGPVCDYTPNKRAYIYKRTVGQSPEVTAKVIRMVVGEMKENGMAGALKHFPGYGSSADTHTGIAYDNRQISEFREKDFKPFQAGIQAGVGGVMVSHNIVTCMDSKNPSSLSPAVHKILREELNFDGVIMTDDISMGAILKLYGNESPAPQAVKAGNDLILTSAYSRDYSSVLKAVKDGKISESRIDQSVRRILSWKKVMGIL